MVAYVALSKRSRGSMEVVLRTSAKVNLALEVLGKRGDGYHEIATVLQAVDLFDRLKLEAADTLSLHTDDPDLPTDDGNLVMRAARLLWLAFEPQRPAGKIGDVKNRSATRDGRYAPGRIPNSGERDK